ncbi:hypothetical protein B6V72_00640 [Thioclava sp. F34-6]|uniref:TonB-dependent receptor plug domain-containing protein n=1 Tax=Thioclava sp. F34-6 TaxID=1973003 RepID=UPI000B546A72|nr:TonB-dependent receptor [Thioclava sp. F34-6]OWY15142.1 hypothetical protein B6V72_00640 [Thioclava sp. F34-6]
MIRTRLTVGLMLTTALAGPALAQDAQPYQLDEIVIYHGALEPRAADKTAQAVTVLSRRDLERSGETRLANIFAMTPGVSILSRGPIGAQTGLSIRGVSQNYVKVQVDGIDVSDPSGPQTAFDFGRLNAVNYDRVEIMRGSQSAVYGGQAVGGVINLDTPRPTREGFSQGYTLEVGSRATVNAAYNLGWKQGEDELSMQLSKIRTSGYSVADKADGNSEADGYHAERLSARGQTRLENGVLIGFAGFAQNSYGELDPQYVYESPAQPSVPLADGVSPDDFGDSKQRALRLFAQFDAAGWSHELDASYFEIDRRSYSHWIGADYDPVTYGVSGSSDKYSDYTYSGSRRTASWTAARDLEIGHLSLGLDYRYESFRQGGYSSYGPVSAGASRKTTGIFGEYDVTLAPGADLVASLRHDDNSAFGGFTTGRLGLTWKLANDLLLRSSVGTGYRAPSGYELYGPFGTSTLHPEKSISYDLGLQKDWDDTSLRATLFRVETRDLIIYNGSNYVQTSGKTVRQGLELEAKGALSSRLDYTLSYTYIDTQNPNNLGYGSSWSQTYGRHNLSASLDAKLTDRLSGSFGAKLVADRAPINGTPMGDYTLANAKLSYDLGAGKEVYLRVDNLFDEQYQQFPGYGTSGRAAYVGLRARF